MTNWNVRMMNRKTCVVDIKIVTAETIQDSFDTTEASHPNHSAISASFHSSYYGEVNHAEASAI